MKKYGAIIRSIVLPDNIIMWECCHFLGRMWNSFSSHISISGLHTEMYCTFVHKTLWVDSTFREVHIKDVHAYCHTSMTWLLFCSYMWANNYESFFVCPSLHGGSWNLGFFPSLLCKFSVGLKNSFFQASSDVLIFLWSSALFHM
jgi:hypothetical protein